MKSGITATANGSRTSISSALSEEDYMGNSLKYSSTYEGSTMPQQEDFSTDFNDRTRNNGEKLIVKFFNTSIPQHFYPIEITTTLECPTK